MDLASWTVDWVVIENVSTVQHQTPKAGHLGVQYRDENAGGSFDWLGVSPDATFLLNSSSSTGSNEVRRDAALELTKNAYPA